MNHNIIVIGFTEAGPTLFTPLEICLHKWTQLNCSYSPTSSNVRSNSAIPLKFHAPPTAPQNKPPTRPSNPLQSSTYLFHLSPSFTFPPFLFNFVCTF
ncbi:hypothetical protein L2E82_16503 [Cichorium intybus]|uniref:Uncharacterized protein n=1 Tax=Cichorium intybus TaxID=13427 RepID=A0ACB9F6B1_CICIN|nr:hypothetical protein L2E82_16503 [Cichorium intybus]